MEFTIRSCLISFLKKESTTNKLAKYPTTSIELNTMDLFFEATKLRIFKGNKVYLEMIPI